MTDDLTTVAGIETVLAATSDYDTTRDAAKARRHIAALRRRLHFAASSGRDGQSLSFNVQVLREELKSALAWLAANEDRTEAQRLANPQMTHADFSTFRGYSPNTSGCTGQANR